MISPQEKAEELYRLFFRTTPQPYYIDAVEVDGKEYKFQDWDKDWTTRMARSQALICVDEILKIFDKDDFSEYYVFDEHPRSCGKIKYWQQVKEEIEKL